MRNLIEVGKEESLLERIVILQMFRPKNWSRTGIKTKFFVISFISILFGLIFFASLKILAFTGFFVLAVMIAGPLFVLWTKMT